MFKTSAGNYDAHSDLGILVKLKLNYPTFKITY